MNIKYFAWLKNITNIDEEVINESSISDLKLLKNYLINKYPKFKKYLDDDVIRVAINLEYTIENKSLKKTDEIAFFPQVSGG